MKTFHGCWPTMITPFKENGKIDYKAVQGLVEWYISHHADGIFAVCQSSEMFFLDPAEKIDLAKAVVEANRGRVKIVASGHTADDHQQQIEELGKMAETGVDAVVLVSNRLAKKEEGEDVFRANADDIFRQLPDVPFGLYECPYPYLRLISDDFLKERSADGKLVFLKDVSCSLAIEKRRAEIVKGSNLSLLCANTATLLDALMYGYDGYNGVMANFHIDLYKWMYENFRKEPVVARELSDFLTLCGVIEARCYPVSAKWHQNAYDVPMSTFTRSKDRTLLNENGILELQSLHRLECIWRERLGIVFNQK